jgi:hypothetical protein
LPDLRGQHNARTRAREEQVEQQVAADMAEEQRLSRLESVRIRRNGVPDGSGGTLHVGPRF